MLSDDVCSVCVVCVSAREMGFDIYMGDSVCVYVCVRACVCVGCV